ncbi:perlucin-like protein [Ruditapes philippinarum]|uniref:perlucin-like protein n=1 Tax=Ruditapes philippinarum TaxID=129788 RepID=UPI00295AEAE0|nr:perlucin-like protein [Ruditapes philippinarum]
MKGYLEVILAFCVVYCVAAQETQYEEKILELERKVDLLARNVNAKECSKCPIGWTRYGGSCYLVLEAPLTFSGARAACAKRRAVLVHINNAEENKFLASYVKRKSKGYNYWIGLTDYNTEGTFRWIDDKSSPTFQNWAYNQPDNAQNREDCVHLITRLNFKWNDRPCLDRIKSICERKITG